MYARASYAAEEFPSYVVSDDDREFGSDPFYAGDPVCPQNARGIEVVPYTTLFLLLALAVGCAFATDATTRQEWTSKLERMASSLTTPEQSTPVPETQPAKDVASVETPGVGSLPPPAAPAAVAIEQPLPEVTVSNAPGDKPESDPGTPAKTNVSDAYAPPKVSTDPYRKKAEAVGLHPDLSRAVLKRLTPADYRNAAYAIQKAVKTVPDDKDFTWPRARKPGLAVFNVHFVQGGARDCRRYVVTITKDRWTSTALPMEKCGVKVAVRGAGKEKSIE
jgi:surface antigen